MINVIIKVVEAYQQWCGSCKAIENIFKKIKMEQSDDMLKFAVVIIPFYL
jgi:thiol-disulfide isomerase/thioredoxin